VKKFYSGVSRWLNVMTQGFAIKTSEIDDMVIIGSNNKILNHKNYFPNMGFHFPYTPLQISRIYMTQEDYDDIVKWSK